MEVDTRFFPVGEFALPSVGDLYKTRVAKGQMPHPIVLAVIVVKQLAPFLPREARIVFRLALPIVCL